MSGPARGPRRPWVLWSLAVLAAAVLAFALGRFSAAPSTGTPNATDLGFARDMQLHEAQATHLAMQAYRTTADPVVQALAYDIATGQARQRGELSGWLAQWGTAQSGRLMSWMSETSGHDHDASATDADLQAAMGMATDAELDALARATGTEADCLFLALMVRHHEGALVLARNAIAHGTQARVLETAEDVRTTQTAELEAMRASQQRLGCPA
jgi:uncharacterized protein (DUF305 family)